MVGRTNSITTPRLIAAAANRDDLAEYIANGGTFGAFARERQMSEQGVRLRWKIICAGLGEQAV